MRREHVQMTLKKLDCEMEEREDKNNLNGIESKYIYIKYIYTHKHTYICITE